MNIIIPAPLKEEYDFTKAYEQSTAVKIIDEALEREEYLLDIGAFGIRMTGGSQVALQYAESSLKQLIYCCRTEGNQSGSSLEEDSQEGGTVMLPGAHIHDKPEFAIRSFHLDSARHMINVSELKKMIRMAAFFKLNTFHWHLTDDQGWRIESMSNPELHLIGGLRIGDHFGKYSDDEPYSAYYTQDQIRDVVNYCSSLGIEVIPEVDMPGHMTALLAAFPEYSCTEDHVEVGTKGGIYEELLCAGKNSTFEFIYEVLDEICDLFPGRYFHIGGDEAPKTRWKACPLCNKRMQDLGLADMRQLQGWFMNEITEHLKSRGKQAIVWNEATYGGNLSPEALVQEWIKSDNPGLVQHIARGGRKLISPVENAYCDHPYGMCSLKDVYMLDTSDPAALGTEVLLWTEYVRTPKHLETFAWPRYTASAECGWSGNRRSRTDAGYEAFAARLKKLLPVFTEYGIEVMDEGNWTPGPAEAQRQIDSFNGNFAPEMLAGVHGDINDVI